MSEQTQGEHSTWVVGFDDERVATFDNEQDAVLFAEVDSQLEGVTAVVTRCDPDGVMTLVRTFVRSGSA